jgi:plasmid stabilization system protein ParE
LGRHRPELGPDVRSKVVLDYPYLVYFRPAPRAARVRVQVVRVLHQARDLDRAFSEDPATD